MTSDEMVAQNHGPDVRGWVSRNHGDLSAFRTAENVTLAFALNDAVQELAFSFVDSITTISVTTSAGSEGSGGTDSLVSEDEDRRYRSATGWRAILAADQFMGTLHERDGTLNRVFGPHSGLEIHGDYARAIRLECEQWVLGPDESCLP